MLVCPSNFEVDDANVMAPGSQSLQKMMALVRTFGDPIRLLQYEDSHPNGLTGACFEEMTRAST